MRFSRVHIYIAHALDMRQRERIERDAEKKLRAHTDLWNDLEAYTAGTISSGASYADYWLLYSYVRHKKPVEVLECGTGVTTVPIAHAMRDNEADGALRGRVTSMENVSECRESADRLLPKRLCPYIDIVLSPKVEDAYSFFRGVCYESVPDRPYSFVYVDGPGTSAPSDSHKTFDLDFVRIVERSSVPVSALVDTRMSTCFVFEHIFKKGSVAYDYRYDVGFVGPVSADDLLSANEVIKKVGPRPVVAGDVELFIA